MPSLQSLPTELIQHIQDDVILSYSYLPNHYTDRQAFLAKCCLVSRPFLSIARPLLYWTIETRDEDHLVDIVVSMTESGHGAHVKKARLRYEGHPTLKLFSKTFPKIEYLRLPRIAMEGLVLLQKLKNLRVLNLGNLYLDCLTEWKFDVLEDLAIVLDDWRNPLILITRKRFPSLKSLAVRAIVPISLERDQLPSFVWTLETLVLDPNTVRRTILTDVARISSPALVATDLRIVTSRPTASIGRLGLVHDVTDQTRQRHMGLEQLKEAQAYLEETPLSFAAIILPSEFLSYPTSAGSIVPLRLREICTAKRIEILYEEGRGSELMVPKVWLEKVRSKDRVEAA